ncbi:MAG: undecaprenyl-diphosphate phosphatase [Eubacterium sp.]|nr:undecaprenyl-diphosphate phosphatase [Eubacterium sp.]
MAILQAIILGCIQGMASFLPISSSGHLVLAGSFLGISADLSLKFLTLMHIGTLAAVCIVMRDDIIRLWHALTGLVKDGIYNLGILVRNAGSFESRDYRPMLKTAYRRLLVYMLVSMGPSILISLILRSFAELGARNLLITAMGFLVTALMLMVSSFSERRRKRPESTRYSDVLIIGVFQGIAVVPGVSRLAMIMAGCSLAGFSRKYTIRYAMLISIPTIIGGLLLEGTSSVSIAKTIGIGPCLIGILIAGLVGYYVLRYTIKLLSGSMNRIFAIYCLTAGVLSVIAYLH